EPLEVQPGLLPGRPPPGAAPGLVAFAPRQVDGLAGGDDEQELPEVVAIPNLGELAAFGAAAEAVEGAERDVLLVAGAARGTAGSGGGGRGPGRRGGGSRPPRGAARRRGRRP